MIVPSIDIRGGRAVQLVGGRKQVLDGGDPESLARRFGRVGEIAVVDLDAALGVGSNAPRIRTLVRQTPCRVGGGIRSADAALEWLDNGAAKVVLGTAARPDVLRRLPRERVVAALDAVDGEVVVDGWRTRTGRGVAETMRELLPWAGGFLVTFVEREGRMLGIDTEEVEKLAAIAGDADLTVAGGVASANEIAKLDRMGVDAQVGMAIYTGRFDLASALAAMARSDRPDGLWPTVIVEPDGTALGLVYSSEQSLRESLETGRGVYHSRRRGLWVKGQTSGDTQELLRVDLDCDRDAMRFTVRQRGVGFCHRGSRSCFGDNGGLSRLARRLAGRKESPPPGSFTARLLDEPELLREKLLEEAVELAEAESPEHVRHETADVIYFALTAMVRAGVSLEEVENELDRRALNVTRRSHTKQKG
jgi:phosphoribosyl-ATP pyrophosphohydrolase